MVLLSPSTLSLLALLSQLLAVLAGNDCGEITWVGHEAKRDVAAATGVPVIPHNPIVVRNTTAVQPGDLVCRFWYPTYAGELLHVHQAIQAVQHRLGLLLLSEPNLAARLFQHTAAHRILSCRI